MEEKSFSENAKDFMSSWKDDYGKKNKDILDSKKKRDQEFEELKNHTKDLFEDLKEDYKGKASDLLENLKVEYEKFVKAMDEGAATIVQKFELEDKLHKAEKFFAEAQKEGADKFHKVSDDVKKQLALYARKKDSPDTAMDDLLDDAKNLNNDIEKGKRSSNDINDLFK